MIGSHNTLSYLPPVNLWGKITKLWGKCQDKNIEEQYNSNVRYFDIRVNYINGVWHIVHNRIDYGQLTNHQDILKYIGNKQIPIRLIYDKRTKPKSYRSYGVGYFLELITELRNKYNIFIDSAITYWNWNEYIFTSKYSIIEYHASVSSKWYQYIFGTKLFAKKYNKQYIENNKSLVESNLKVLLIDYI